MKKYITLFSIVALFFMGLQSSVAQDAQRQRPEAIAKQQTYDIHKLVTLTGDQQGEVFKVLVEQQTSLSGIEENTKSIATAQEAKLAVLENTNKRLKAILTPEQYKIYQESLEKEKK
ncbi:hypothetical protein [Hanstruepera flava]|uniref:hypothetical protein n=1 Tax=Hanstruepera flava TaxID=2930218 RepID=UPI00202780AC|nr:hypothetical protein [Hanstruepera flava]